MSGVRDNAQKVLSEAEQRLDEANELSDNINRELEVVNHSVLFVFFGGRDFFFFFSPVSLCL